MENAFKKLSESERWAILVEAALNAAEAKGMKMTRRPGRGKSNVWFWHRGGEDELVSIRTSQDRAIAFPPLEGGTKWKTLDEVQHVIVAAVDDSDNPKAVDVYMFDQAEVRRRFDLNYKTRIEAGQSIPDNYGNWVALDVDDRGIPQCAGSGIAAAFPPIANYQLSELMSDTSANPVDNEISPVSSNRAIEPATIGDTIGWARRHIAKLASVPIESVRLDLKIEYA